MMTPEERANFKKYCRAPGTRSAQIIDMIERGDDHMEIARRFGTSVATIKVWEKAWRGELSRLCESDIETMRGLSDSAIRRIAELYMEGSTVAAAGRAVGVNREKARAALNKAERMGILKERRKVKTPRMVLTQEQREEILKWREQGMTAKVIAQIMEKPYATVKHFIKNFT